MKQIHAILLIIGMLFCIEMNASFNLTVSSTGMTVDWSVAVDEDVVDDEGTWWNITWKMSYLRTASVDGNGTWSYLTETKTYADLREQNGITALDVLVQNDTSTASFSIVNNHWDTFGIFFPPTGSGTPLVPRSDIEDSIGYLAGVFQCYWDDGTGNKNRVVTGNWEDDANFIIWNYHRRTDSEVVVHDWSERDPMDGDRVKVTWTGTEQDLIWTEDQCLDGGYSESIFIEPTGDGSYSLPAPPNGSTACNGIPGGRKQTGADRDHTITHLAAVQAN